MIRLRTNDICLKWRRKLHITTLKDSEPLLSVSSESEEVISFSCYVTLNSKCQYNLVSKWHVFHKQVCLL